MMKRFLVSLVAFAIVAPACGSKKDSGASSGTGTTAPTCASMCAKQCPSDAAGCQTKCDANRAAKPECAAKYDAILACVDAKGTVDCSFMTPPSACKTETDAFTVCAMGTSSSGGGSGAVTVTSSGSGGAGGSG